MAEAKLTCVTKVWDSVRHRHHRCDRPAKGVRENGYPACGIHLNAERKRNERERAEEERAEARKSRLRFLGALRDTLSLEGVAVSVSWRGLIIHEGDALKLIERLRGESRVHD